MSNDLINIKKVIFYGQHECFWDRIETKAGVLAGMSGGPCLIKDNESSIKLIGIVLRSNNNLTANVCININILL